MNTQNIVFALVLAVAAATFSFSVQRLYRFLRLGVDTSRADEPLRRLWNVLSIGIAQRKILRDRVAGPLHALVFWGFIVLTAGSAEILARGVVPAFSYERLVPGSLYGAFLFSQEIFALFVLVAVAVLLYRRIVVKPRRLQGDNVHSGDAILILSMIAVLMITLFLMAAFDRNLGAARAPAMQPVSTPVALALKWMSPAAARAGHDVSWWIHATVILIFLNYLPYSKHLHIIVALPNTWLSNTSGPGVIGAMRPMDLEREDATFGAEDVTQLTWKNLLDGYACTECGRCTAACPASITGKPLSPRKIVINTRQRLMELAPVMLGDRDPAAASFLGTRGPTEADAAERRGHRLLDHYITEEELWACTSCRACVQECPVSIDQLEIINELRRSLVLSESRFPEEVLPAFESLERNGSPWAFPRDDRALWAEGLGIPTMADLAARGERPDVLFWVGCMGSFDDRAKKIAVAFTRILQAGGVRFAILGREESCHGDPARRMGNEYLYQILARQAIETLDRYAVTTIVTSCPHCFHQMAREFPQLGGHYEVIHHSTYIARLLQEGRVPLDNDENERLTIAYHDSCYLGRYNGIYDSPRETLRRALPIVTLSEPARSRDRGLCCGAGGGRMFMEERVGKRINVERTEELLQTGADALAVACPFCMTMISDGVAALGSDTPVLDVAEVVAQRLSGGVVTSQARG
jgi:Fe-S oxidoreductase/uncharacterized membrane protein